MSRRTVPKYSWEILVVQAVAMIACIVFLFLDEYRLYAYLVLPLMISYAIQYYRLRRARKQLNQKTIQILQAIAKHQNRELTLYEPQHTIDDALKGLREDIERHRIAKHESQS